MRKKGQESFTSGTVSLLAQSCEFIFQEGLFLEPDRGTLYLLTYFLNLFLILKFKVWW